MPATRSGFRKLLPRLLLALLLALPGPAGAADSGYAARIQIRHPDGTEESVVVSDFRFVYFSRRFIRHATGIGKPPDLEIRDEPNEVRSIENEDLHKLKFAKLVKVQFEIREEGERRGAFLVATWKKKKKPPAVWPVASLRNTSTAEPPIFRAVADGKTLDLTPLRGQAPESMGPSLIGFELEFPGMKPRKKRF